MIILVELISVPRRRIDIAPIPHVRLPFEDPSNTYPPLGVFVALAYVITIPDEVVSNAVPPEILIFELPPEYLQVK